jgi:hypothetical protein
MLVLVLPPAAWVVVPAVRVLAPRWVGMTCVSDTLCVDDPALAGTAAALAAEADEFVSRHVDQIGRPPRIVFCSTQECARTFGLGRRASLTLGTFGIVIGPRAWQPYLVRHEMIHYLQGRRLNVFLLLFKPEWFVEGMAYALSEDPRHPLPEPFESWRAQFLAWYAQVGPERLWQEARRL